MISKALRHFRMERDDRDVVTVWIDVAGRTMNVFDDSVIGELEHVVRQLEIEATAAIVFRSAKRTGFFAGADIKTIARLTPADVEDVITRGQQLFSRIEKLSMPTVAAVHGPCLGGGLELALACSNRIAMNVASTRLALPEIQLGLIPGWGGTQRLPKLVGLADALPMILQGKKLTADAALRLGLADAVADEANWESFVSTFVDALLAGDFAKPAKSSSRKSVFRSFGDTWPIRWLTFLIAEKQIAREGKNYPALPAALRAVRAAYQRGMNGFAVERKEFARLIASPTCRNLLNLFFWRERARAAVSAQKTSTEDTNRITEHLETTESERMPALQEAETNGEPIRTIGIIGAGAMGAGIGQLAALQGLNVVFKELNAELAKAGMGRVTKLLDDMISKKRLSAEERDAVLTRVSASDRFEALVDCDLVIEAVVEKMAVKQAVFAELDQVLKPTALIATNTSALSVSEIGKQTGRQDRIAGLHFFNPVHRMDLVEVIRTEATTDATTKLLLQLVKKLGKTPVVTSDSPGFLVNRVLFPYIGEAVRMVLEGADCRELDRDVKQFGMPMGPLELIDHVGIDVAWHVAETLKDVLPESDRVIAFLGQMVVRGWTGRKGDRGFYEYAKGSRGNVNLQLKSLVADRGTWPADAEPPNGSIAASVSRSFHESIHPHAGAFLPDGLSEIQRRLIYAMINEVGFCMQDGVVQEAWMADLAVILGTGFAPFRGGPVTFADRIGQSTLLNNLHVLSVRHGERFKPSAWLVNRPIKTAGEVECVE